MSGPMIDGCNVLECDAENVIDNDDGFYDYDLWHESFAVMTAS